MRKILIINKSFELGGIQMALKNMLEAIGEEYSIDLAIFNPHGPMKKKLPQNTKLLTLSPLVQVLGMNVDDCKKYGTPLQKVYKLIGSVWSKLFSNELPVKFAMAFQKDLSGYDYVISYHQETSAKTLVTGFGYFALKKVHAPTKIAWVHADFMATQLATRKNYKIYKQFDRIVAVSKTTKNSFVTAYPELENKVTYCYNYIPAHEIEKKSMEPVEFKEYEDKIILFSAGRLTEEKGYVDAAKEMAQFWDENDNFVWIIAGEGPQRKELEDVIIENNLEEKLFLIGFKDNPYPYILRADYLFVPSRHETFSMVVGEAHVLRTPVLASKIPIMQEVLDENDIEIDITAEDLRRTISRLCKKNDFVFKRQRSKDWNETFKNAITGENQ